MHELAIVDALIEQVQQEVQQSGVRGRVTRLDLVIGRLSGVCPDSIRFAFEMLARDTVLETAEIRIEEPAAVCPCLACGSKTEIVDLGAVCPACSSPNVSIEGGQDLLLQSIELEDDSPGNDPGQQNPVESGGPESVL